MSQIQKNLVSLLVLAVFAGGVGLYAYFGVHQGAEREERQKAANERLLSLGDSADDSADAGSHSVEFTKLVITAKNDTTTLEKRDGKWRMVSPIDAAVDDFAVDQVTSELQSGKLKDTIEEKPTAADLKKYGLDAPRFTVVATVKPSGAGAARELTLKGGIENTFDGSIYVQRDADPKVYSVQGGVRWNLEKSTFDLRSKKVLAVPEHDVRRFEVSGGKNAWALERGADNKTWTVVKPKSFQADTKTVNDLLQSLSNVTATSYFTDSPAERTRVGVDKPVFTAEFIPVSGDPIRFVFGHPADKASDLYVLRTEGAKTELAQVPGTALAQLDKEPSQFRDKTVVRFDKNEVARIAFVKDGKKLLVERVHTDAGSNEDWRVVEPEKGPAKKWMISSLLWTLGSLKAKEFGEENPKSWAKWGLDKPESEVELFDRTGKELATLALGKEVEGAANTRFARGTRDQVLQLETTRLSDLPSSVDDLLDRPVPAATDAGTK